MAKGPNYLALAIEHQTAGRLVEAEILYRKILASDPQNESSLNNLAVLANQAGKYQIALELSEQLLAINPDQACAHNNKGNALSGLGKTQQAIVSYKDTLRLKPDYPEALYSLGLELERARRSQEAVEVLQKALVLTPNFSDGHNALGLSFRSIGKTSSAIDAFKTALRLQPASLVSLNNLGNAYAESDQLTDAVLCYQEALRLRPDSVEALNNIGNVLARLGSAEEAISAFQAAVVLKPDFVEARASLIAWKQSSCDWRNAVADEEAFLACARQHPSRIDPFFLLLQKSTLAEQLRCAQSYARRTSAPPEKQFRHLPGESNRKIRLGYISAGVHQQSNAFFSVDLYEHHDRDRFEVVGYFYGSNQESEMRARVQKSVDNFVDIRHLSPQEAAAKIHGDGIDILIDQQGYTIGHQAGILSYRPAAIQVNYPGFLGTTGSECVHYIIGDKFCLPLEEQASFSEKIVHMPHCYQGIGSHQEFSGQRPTRKECGLPEQGFVFCCFSNVKKIRPEFFNIWMRLLNEVDGSVLWLLSKSAFVKDNLKREAARRGIDPDRLAFAPQLSRADHLARQPLADLFLDTLPYNSDAGARDALRMRVPLVTCTGTTFAGRVTGSTLRAVGLSELVASNLAEYEGLARRLAVQPEFIERVRKKLEGDRLECPLFDVGAYTRYLEKAYEKMWQSWLSGRKPEPLIV